MLTIIGDIHGCYDELGLLLTNLTINSEIISVGDIFDRGPDAVKCLELLFYFNAKLVIGNHDEKFIKYLKQKRTVEQVPESRQKQYDKLLKNTLAQEFLLNGKYFIQRNLNNKTVTIVHAGVTRYTRISENLDKASINHLLRTRYIDYETKRFVALENVNDKWVPPKDKIVEPWQVDYNGETIIHGHNIVGNHVVFWPKENKEGGNNIFDYKAISLDTGAFMGGNLSAININDDGEFAIISVKSKNYVKD